MGMPFSNKNWHSFTDFLKKYIKKEKKIYLRIGSTIVNL